MAVEQPTSRARGRVLKSQTLALPALKNQLADAYTFNITECAYLT